MADPRTTTCGIPLRLDAEDCAVVISRKQDAVYILIQIVKEEFWKLNFDTKRTAKPNACYFKDTRAAPGCIPVHCFIKRTQLFIVSGMNVTGIGNDVEAVVWSVRWRELMAAAKNNPYAKFAR